MWNRIVNRWVYGAALAGVLLLVLLPLLARQWPAWKAATFLLLPIYMLHQLEEHDADRFRRFVNETMGRGKEVLSPFAVFLINIPGVWGIIALACYLGWFVRPGLGLIATYLVLVNALAHIGGAAAMRRYNPGLVTAVVLFLPTAAWSLRALDAAGATASDHLAGLVVALVIHAAIVLHVRRSAAAVAPVSLR